MDYTKTEIIIRDFKENPHCDHGSTVLYSRNGKRFFSCSAFRSRDLCPFYMEEYDFLKQKEQSDNNQTKVDSNDNDTPSRNTDRITLGQPFTSRTNKNGQAQFFFSNATLQFLMDSLKAYKVKHLLCIGTPSIHREFKLWSYLLDIDKSFECTVRNFSLYNMCNHHFFKAKENYLKFLKNSKTLTVICDPAFGAKLELIFNTFRMIESEWRSFGHKRKLHVILIHPYFSEGKLRKIDETFHISDVRIEYEGHKKFKKGEKSPIRLFTNMDLAKLKLPKNNYKYCSKCSKYVFKISKHCEICKGCDSRDGKGCKHCNECDRCVKSTWIHCPKCNRCHHPNDECGKYLKKPERS